MPTTPLKPSRVIPKKKLWGKSLSEIEVFVGRNKPRQDLRRLIPKDGLLSTTDIGIRAKSGKVLPTLISADFAKISGKCTLFIAGIDISEQLELQRSFQVLVEEMPEISAAVRLQSSLCLHEPPGRTDAGSQCPIRLREADRGHLHGGGRQE